MGPNVVVIILLIGMCGASAQGVSTILQDFLKGIFKIQKRPVILDTCGKEFVEKMVGETGFEPATLWTQTRCATGLRHSPTFDFTIELEITYK